MATKENFVISAHATPRKPQKLVFRDVNTVQEQPLQFTSPASAEKANSNQVQALSAALDRSNKNLGLCQKVLKTALSDVQILKKQLAVQHHRRPIPTVNDHRSGAVNEAVDAKMTSTLSLQTQQQQAELQQTNSTLQEAVSALQVTLGSKEDELQHTVAASAKLTKQLEASQTEVETLQQLLEASRLRERQLRAKVLALKGNIRVLCRVRPLLPHEITNDQTTSAAYADTQGHCVSVLQGQKGRKGSTLSRQQNFEYDRVFGPEAQQDEIFCEELQDAVKSVVQGYNVCVFAYGQTGSGKTYTMEGGPGQEGLNHRALDALFAETTATANSNINYTVQVSMLEVYNERLYDLLSEEYSAVTTATAEKLAASTTSMKTSVSSPAAATGSGKKSGGMFSPSSTTNTTGEAKQKLHILSSGGIVTVHGLNATEVSTAQEVHALIVQGMQARTQAATNVHDRSSRSHCVLTVTVHGEHKHTGTEYFGKLHLVDLAGSENVHASGVVGNVERLREAKNINRSLSALGDVFLGMSQSKKYGGKQVRAHIPFRNSKLTHLLSDSLGGDSRTLMMVCLNPQSTCLSETLNSLTFAKRVRQICLGTATANKKLKKTTHMSLVERQMKSP